jgi:hypothetical protein
MEHFPLRDVEVLPHNINREVGEERKTRGLVFGVLGLLCGARIPRGL